MLATPALAAFAILGAAALLVGPGYALRLRALPRRDDRAADPGTWPAVDVVVPTHEEASRIAEKVGNLRALRYPGALRFWIADGASADGTRAIAETAAAGDRRFAVLALPVAGKTAQLNRALALCTAKWIAVTDADARLAPDTLARLVQEGEADPAVGAVGTAVRPSGAHASERLHWRIADRLRLAESRRGAASIVTGPCYLFRREGGETFPPDAVADDVHAAFRAAASGRRVAFVAADVEELRNPVSLAELARHKYRKGRAYLREVIRFLPRTRGMTPAARAVFRWRAAQLLLGPPIAALLAVSVLAAGDFRGWTAAALVAGAAVSASRRVRAAAGLAAALGLALVAAIVALPFPHEAAPPPKIDGARRRCTDADIR